MRPIQILEVRDKRVDSWSDIKWLEHVATHEIGKVSNRLHRNRLMEQLKRLIVVDTETATEPCTVLREAIFYVCTQSAQLPTQLRNIGTEVREIARDRQITLSANEESGWLP